MIIKDKNECLSIHFLFMRILSVAIPPKQPLIPYSKFA